MTSAPDPLLEPYQLKGLHLRNRIFSSAHEPAYSEDGMPKDRYRLYHVEKAKGGIGLTMTAGSAVVAQDSPPAFGNLHAYDDNIVPWLRRLTDEVHEHGAACMIQITHLGRRTHWAHGDWLPTIAPSPIPEPAHRATPKEAETWDIDRITANYADAAERMKASGMDGIEIEAYGHLFDQFWSPATNHRTDSYGGDTHARLTFGRRVLTDIRERVGPDFVVGIRMAIDERIADGIDAPEGLVILDELSGIVDFVNVIRGNIATDAALTDVIPIQGMPSAPHLDFAATVRRRTDLTVMHASKIDDVATARHAIAEGKLDLVGMTRAVMADPHLVTKLSEGRPEQIRPCVGATYCLDRIYEGREALCIHNAATSREASMPHMISGATETRSILVIGAGPAGLEAARVAAERQHHVTLIEAMPAAGGQVNLATRNSRRIDLQGIVDWRLSECQRLGVEIRYNTVADEELVRQHTPDAVIIATGGQPRSPLPQDEAALATSTWEVLAGYAKPSGNVLLYDETGSHAAMSAGELIARSGCHLDIVTPERTLAIDVGGTNHVPYARAFNETNTTVTLNHRLQSITTDGDQLTAVLGSDYTRHKAERRVDWVVVDHGTAPNDELYVALKPGSANGGAIDHQALLSGVPQPKLLQQPDSNPYLLYRIGDAVSGRNIHAAIYDALRLMKDI